MKNDNKTSHMFETSKTLKIYDSFLGKFPARLWRRSRRGGGSVAAAATAAAAAAARGGLIIRYRR